MQLGGETDSIVETPTFDVALVVGGDEIDRLRFDEGTDEAAVVTACLASERLGEALGDKEIAGHEYVERESVTVSLKDVAVSLEMQMIDDDGDGKDDEIVTKIDPEELKKDPDAWKKHLAKIKKKKAEEAERRRVARDKLLAEVLSEEGEAALESMNPLALQAKLVEGTNPNDPQILLRKCVEVRLTVNPVFDAVMHKLGAFRRGKRTYSFFANPDVAHDNFKGILKALPTDITYPEAMWKEGKLGKNGGHKANGKGFQLRSLFAQTSLGKHMGHQIVGAVNADSGHYPAHGRRHAAISIGQQDNELTFKVMTQKSSDTGEVQLFENAPNLHNMRENDMHSGQLVTPTVALSLIGEAQAQGIRTVVDPRIEGLRGAADDATMVRPVPGKPGKAEVLVGKNSSASHPGLLEVPGGWGAHSVVLPAKEAVKMLEGHSDQLVDEDVEDILAMEDAEVVDIDGMMPHQNEAIAIHLATNKGFLNAMDPGLGKGHPVDTDVLTPTGWRRIGDLTPGDEVIGSDGRPTRVVAVFDRGVLPVYDVSFNDGSHVLCDADHVWTVRPRGQKPEGGARNWSDKDVRELMDDLHIRDGIDADGQPKLRLKYHIPLTAPVEFASRPLRIAPYTMGILLGEGSFETRELTITNADPEVFASVASELREGVNLVPKNSRDRCPAMRISAVPGNGAGNYVRAALREWGLEGKHSYEKFVPEEYLLAPVEDRIALLQGLLDADGSVHMSYVSEFSTTSPKLRDAVKFLVRSLGGVTHESSSYPTYSYKGETRRGRLAWKVFVTLPDGVAPYRLARKATPAVAVQARQLAPRRMLKSIVPAGEAEVRCIKVAAADELYVTEDFLVTHNTPTTLTACQQKWERKEAAGTGGYRALVSAEKSQINQWRDEAAKFFPGAQIFMLDSKARLSKLLDRLNEHDLADPAYPLVVVTTHGAVRGALPILMSHRWDDFIVDEAAFLKSRNTKQSDAIWELRQNADCAVALTGTPIDKGLDDLGALISWARNDTSLFAGSKLSDYDITDEDDLKEMGAAMGPALFRRDSSIMEGKIPRMRTQVKAFDPHASEQALFNGARQELRTILEENQEMMQKQIDELSASGDITEEEREEAQAAVQALKGAGLGAMMFNRQIGSDVQNAATSESVVAAIVDERGLVEPAVKQGGTKRAGIADYVKTRVEADKPAIVFTEFIPSMTVLKSEFEDKGLRVGMIHGQQTSKERTANQEAFQGVPCETHFRRPGAVKGCEECTQPTVDVIVCTRAANKGLNLQRGATQVHYDMSWVPSDFSQRVGRSRRFGSDEEEIEVTIAMMKGTMEERVGALLVPRAMQALMALDGTRNVDLSHSSLSGMSKEMSNNLSEAHTGGDNASIFKMAKELVLADD